MKRFYLLFAFMLTIGRLWAAEDPFVGKWKFDESKSKMTGEQIQIQDLGGNKYKWTVGKITDTLAYDGTDQPAHFDRTISMTPAGTNSWKMVIKKDGRVLSTMTHTISTDGKTQTIKGTETKPDGTTSDFDATWKKISGGSGWAGTWQEADVKFTSPDEFDISQFEGDGLTFDTPAYKDTLSMKFDGKDYEEKGPNVAAGSASSGKRVNARTLEVTDKLKSEVLDHTTFAVSGDGNTLTLTVHETGQKEPQTYVYNKL